jgi:hypothetical protein
MNNRAAAWFAAVVFFLAGIWLSYEGWQKKWGTKGISFRVAGIAALAAGGFCAFGRRRS